MRVGRFVFTLCVASLVILPAIAFAAGPDKVVMRNGDQITGEIQEIWDGDLIIEPEYDDDTKVSLPLAEVSYMESEREFDVTWPDRTEVVVRLLGPSADGRQLIEVNGEKRVIDLGRIDELDEIDEYFDWESHIDLNGSFDRGNTDATNIKFFADSNIKLGDHRHIASMTFAREEQNGIRTKEQDLLQYNYNWLFNQPWFFGATGSAERDPIKDLDYRYIAGGTLGNDLFNRARVFLSVQFGLGYLAEKNTTNESQQSVVGIWALRYRQKFLKDLEFYHDDSINTYLTGRNNTVFKTTTGLRYEITDRLYANTSLDYDYETEPAGIGVENDDLTWVFGLGLEF
jgi:putative salt-induced outer membrane protein YdiY